ncbi:TRAP transporter large permease subunit, partial [Aurantimonas sp. C2-5-R2]|uniref:TRAP transporter large permease subunit n=1 Tax=Aurantimonas sp. C2-5-R2 TaxID=3113713 RepID=UPI002F94D4BF
GALPCRYVTCALKGKFPGGRCLIVIGTEGALYSLLIGLFVYREMTLATAWRAIREAAVESASILLIMATATAFAWALSFEQAPQMAVSALMTITADPILLFLLLGLLYLVLGLFMEAIAIVTMTIPVVIPVLQSTGIDPVHFGVVLALIMSIGTITPPLGIVMFTLCRISGMAVEEFTGAIWPWLVLLVVITVILILVPQLVLYLPQSFDM